MTNSKNKLMIAVLVFCIVMLFSFLFTNNVYADTATSMTIVDTVGGAETKFNPSTTDKSGNGWSWSSSTETLTLNSYNGGRIEANGDFTLKLNGANTMSITGEGAKGLYTDYSRGTIKIENTTSDINDKLTINCTNVNGDDLVSGMKVNINGGTLNLNVIQTEEGLGRAYGPYCNSGTSLYNGGRLNITMTSNYSSSTLQGSAGIYCYGSGNVMVLINGVSSSVGLGGLRIQEGSTSHVTINVQDSNPEGNITYAVEGLYGISETGSLVVQHGRVITGWSYSSYPDISSKIKITPKNSSKDYILFPIVVYGYRVPTYIDATTFEPIEDGISFIPQTEEVPFSAVNTTILDLKANRVGETAVTTYQELFTYYIPSVLHGLNPYVSNQYASYEVISGTLPEGVGVSPTYGHVSGTYTEMCDAGSFTVRVTRLSDHATADVVINYGAVAEEEKYVTVDANTVTECNVDINSDATGSGWKYTGATNTLELNNYTGGPIYSEKGLNIVLKGTNTIYVAEGATAGLSAEYFKSDGELGISAVGNSSLTINVAADCTTISNSVINANKFNLYSGNLSIVGHDCEDNTYGIYCNNGATIHNDANLSIDLSTNNEHFVEGVNSLSVGNHTGIINIAVASDYGGVNVAVCYLKVSGGNSQIYLSAKTNNANSQNYATEDIRFEATQGKIVVSEGIVGTSYDSMSLFRCTNKTKITANNTSRQWVLVSRKNYLNYGCIFTDSNTLEVIKDGITIEAVTTNIPLKFHNSKAFYIPKSKIGDEIHTFNGSISFSLRGGFEGINIYEENMTFEIISGTLPKGIGLEESGTLYGTFLEITQPGRVKIRATRKSDNSKVEFYLNYDKVIDEDPSLVFPDIANGKWYTEAIAYVKDHGMMSGYTSGVYAGEFGPEDTISRGQIVTILYRFAGEPSVTGLSNPFTDVPEGKYYTDAIKWAVQNGITTGKTATSFDPNGNVTRQELAVFMARYAKNILGKNINSSYSITGIADYSNLSTWAIEPMKYIMEKGVITGDMALGYPRILPTANATRAAAATMMMRFCKNIAGM